MGRERECVAERVRAEVEGGTGEGEDQGGGRGRELGCEEGRADGMCGGAEEVMPRVGGQRVFKEGWRWAEGRKGVACSLKSARMPSKCNR